MLIRTRLSGKQAQWLLMKRSDKAPRKAKTALSEAPSTSRVPDFIEPQLAYLVSEPPRGKEWIHEAKFDGYRIETILQNGVCRLRTRSGQDWSAKYPEVAKALKKLKVKNTILDGEVVALDEKGRSQFQLLQNAMQSSDQENIYYYVFDCLFLDGKDLRDVPLAERKKTLKSLLKPLAKSPVRFVEGLDISGKEFLDASCDYGLEGIVSKQRDSIYESGRVESWVKSKCTQRQEFVIGGYTDPQGKREGFGALLLGVYDGNKLRYVGKVGTGFNQQNIASLVKKLTPLLRKKTPFNINSPTAKGIHWIQPELAAEIQFSEWTNDQILRVPVFQGLREDKPAEEIHVEKIKDADLTHPDKLLYQKEEISKQDVADYYDQVGKYLLPHCRNRPLTLFRCPNGTEEPCFYQRHPKAGEEYFLVDSAKDIKELVQISTIELHGWNCRLPKIDSPDQVVLDLDPGPGILWKQIVQCALDIKKALENRSLECFVKLSGGKGVHIHIPLKPIHTWDEVSEFAKDLALEMTAFNSLYISEMTKSRRAKKIYVDYLRNNRGSTAVVPYSLRAKETSAVAMPVAWDELKKFKSGGDFTLKKALERIHGKYQDPWKGYDKVSQSLKAKASKKRRRH